MWITTSVVSTTATTMTGNTEGLLFYWVTSSASTGSTWTDPQAQYAAAQWDAQERMGAAWLREQQRRQARILSAIPKSAQDRAHELLLSQLTPQQRESMQLNKWFIVEGKSGIRYRVRAKESLVANVDVLDGESVRHRLCAHCDISRIPLADHLLAQKLMLESAEEEFLRIANRHAA